MKPFAQVLVDQRRNRGLTQKAVAAQVGVSAQYLNDLERGRRKPPPDQMIERIAEALDLHPNGLYFFAGRIPPSLRDDFRVLNAFAQFSRSAPLPQAGPAGEEREL